MRGGRTTQRQQRQAVPLATIALVGYTNAGKSTLFNRLTGADVLADARMFATLDPTVRHVTLPSHRRVLMSDTVGFIRNLPTTLVKAFRATLEEVVEAELLLHVVDASSPHAPSKRRTCWRRCSEIGAATTPQILVLNKIDKIPGEPDASSMARRILKIRTISRPARWRFRRAPAKDSTRCSRRSTRRCRSIRSATALFRIPAGEGGPMHTLHEHARVTSTRYTDEMCVIRAETSGIGAAQTREVFGGLSSGGVSADGISYDEGNG